MPMHKESNLLEEEGIFGSQNKLEMVTISKKRSVESNLDSPISTSGLSQTMKKRKVISHVGEFSNASNVWESSSLNLRISKIFHPIDETDEECFVLVPPPGVQTRPFTSKPMLHPRKAASTHEEHWSYTAYPPLLSPPEDLSECRQGTGHEAAWNQIVSTAFGSLVLGDDESPVKLSMKPQINKNWTLFPNQVSTSCSSENSELLTCRRIRAVSSDFSNTESCPLQTPSTPQVHECSKFWIDSPPTPPPRTMGCFPSNRVDHSFPYFPFDG